MFVNLVQLPKQLSKISITPLGIIIDFIFVYSNELKLISFNVYGNMILVTI